uniref:Death domain-containing protein n=1 Tax=Amphimedon queenslandica TaxID=400682 RepID=A0A1X7UKU2_AMPQE
MDESLAENQNENLIVPETEVNAINPVLNDLEQDNQLNVFPDSSTIGNAYSADLDLAIENGHTIKVMWSTLCISGPSGSGKSSLIELLLGKEPLLTHTSTSVLGAIESRGFTLLLITDDINCTWEEIQDIKGLLCEALRSGAITPLPNGEDRFDFSFEALPHSFSYACYNEVLSKAITSPVSPIVEDMRCLLQKQSVSHFVNAPPTYHFVSIIDTGGHEAFFDIIPALHCYGSANIVIHKLDEKLSSKVFSFYCLEDEIIGEIEERQLTNQQYLVSSIRSSTSINPPQISGFKTQLHKFQSQIIVGTFSAEINQIESLIAKNSILRANTINCEHHISLNGKNLLFPINATARDDYHSQIATEIRKHVCDSYIEADVPLKWFLFLLHLQELCIGLCIARKADCIEIGSLLQMTENEVEAALLYFRDVKMILYWPYALPQIVFLQPQYLYDKITQLVLASFLNSHKHFENKGIKLHLDILAEYQDKGIFSLELLHSICEPFNNEDFTAMELLQLLKNLVIIVEIPHLDGDDMHFFPSILPILSTDSDEFETLQKEYTEELEPLILSWPTRINPQGLFPALIVKLLNDSQPHLFNLKPECRQYRNAIQLECVAYRGSVLLVDTVYNVEVFYDSGRRSKFDKWISSHVRESIFDEVRSIVSQFHYDDRLANPVKKFVCLKHNEYTKHYCIITKNNRLSCERDKSVMEISQFNQNPWLQKINLDITDLNYPLHLLKEFTIHWNRLGLALGLTQQTLDIIDHDHPSRSEECFRICLQKWLEKSDNVHIVTWVSLADALFPFNDNTNWVNQL